MNPKHERFTYLLRSYFASKVVDTINSPHEITDEDFQLLENALYFFDSSFTGKRKVLGLSDKPVLKPDFPSPDEDNFTNYDLTLTVIENCHDTLFSQDDNLVIVHTEIETIMLKIVDEIVKALDKKFINKNDMITTYIFFQEFKRMTMKKSIEIARKK